MERTSTPARGSGQIDDALLAAAARRAAPDPSERVEPAKAIDEAVGALHDAVAGLFPSVFVLEHGRLWLVAQRGYAVVPDGIRVDQGIMGRAIRLGHDQLAQDVQADPDYLGALPSVSSELAIPLRAGALVVGALNVESERPLPENAAELIQPLAEALAPLAEELRERGTLDLAALARLFVHLGGLRDPDEISALAAASLSRVLPVDVSQVVVWGDAGAAVELAAWKSEDASRLPLSESELGAMRALVDPNVVCQLLDAGARPAARSSGSRCERAATSSERWSPRFARARAPMPCSSTPRPCSPLTSGPRSTSPSPWSTSATAQSRTRSPGSSTGAGWRSGSSTR